jgi:hyaluronate lyase
MIGNYGDEEDAYIRHFVKYSVSTPEQLAVAKNCSLGNYPEMKRILGDDTIPTENDYTCAHAWYTADRATQHKDDYAFLVSMPSYRHPNYESINHANMTGWYMNDGTLYLYTKNDAHAFDGVNFVLNTRLAHRMPGTTVDVRERKAVSVSSGWRPNADKVGCMDFDKKYVVAGMDYDSYHRDEDELKVDVGYGGGNPKFINDLVAKKAYFMFDDECVCLGAGINSTMNSDINTVVEHRRLVKLDGEPFGKDLITVDGEVMENTPYERTFEKPSYARVEDFAGYVFLDADKVSVSKYMYEILSEKIDIYLTKIPEYAKGKRPFVEIMINHGKNPKDATYAYAVLPYASEEKTALYAKKPEVEIISNTPTCQAVRKPSLGVTGIIFYEAGECCGIKVDTACLVTFMEKDGEFKIKVAEPTNKVDAVTVEISKRLAFKSADRHCTAECAEVTKLTVQTELSVGEGYETVFYVNE